MPTISSGGIKPPALFFRISDSTPGAILQPQPPPCEKLVRRIGPEGTVQAVEVSFMMRFLTRFRSLWQQLGGRIDEKVAQQSAHVGGFNGGREPRLAPSALGCKLRDELRLDGEMVHQRGQRRRVAERVVGGIVWAEHGDVAGDGAYRDRALRRLRFACVVTPLL